MNSGRRHTTETGRSGETGRPGATRWWLRSMSVLLALLLGVELLEGGAQAATHSGSAAHAHSPAITAGATRTLARQPVSRAGITEMDGHSTRTSPPANSKPPATADRHHNTDSKPAPASQHHRNPSPNEAKENDRRKQERAEQRFLAQVGDHPSAKVKQVVKREQERVAKDRAKQERERAEQAAKEAAKENDRRKQERAEQRFLAKVDDRHMADRAKQEREAKRRAEAEAKAKRENDERDAVEDRKLKAQAEHARKVQAEREDAERRANAKRVFDYKSAEAQVLLAQTQSARDPSRAKNLKEAVARFRVMCPSCKYWSPTGPIKQIPTEDQPMYTGPWKQVYNGGSVITEERQIAVGQLTEVRLTDAGFQYRTKYQIRKFTHDCSPRGTWGICGAGGGYGVPTGKDIESYQNPNSVRQPYQ